MRRIRVTSEKATGMDSTSEFRVRSKVCDWSFSGSVEVIWCYEFGRREGTKRNRSHDVGCECGQCRVRGLLQQMGYYTGEVDGLLGPLTRQALTAYQADQGLATTASIDEPTLDSLGLA